MTCQHVILPLYAHGIFRIEECIMCNAVIIHEGDKEPVESRHYRKCQTCEGFWFFIPDSSVILHAGNGEGCLPF